MKPKDWGPHLWNALHVVALGYPTTPTWQQKFDYKTFFTGFGNILPCFKCSINYKRHLVELPIDTFLESRSSLFEWTVRLHNIVNREVGKRELSTDQAYAYIVEKMTIDKSDSTQIYWKLMLLVTSNVVLVGIIVFLVYFRRKG
jgi:hypothetical protein